VTATNHALTGAVIALAVDKPLLAIPLALLSHFALDALPHWDYAINRSLPTDKRFFDKKFNTLLGIDLLIAFIAMVIIGINFPDQKWLIWSCMATAAAPDAMWAYYRGYLPKFKHIKPKLNWIARFHQNIQWSQTAAGFFVEIAWFIGLYLIILKLK
jgi:hypothetical protein